MGPKPSRAEGKAHGNQATGASLGWRSRGADGRLGRVGLCHVTPSGHSGSWQGAGGSGGPGPGGGHRRVRAMMQARGTGAPSVAGAATLGTAALRATPGGPRHESRAGQRRAASGDMGEKEVKRSGVTGGPALQEPCQPARHPPSCPCHFSLGPAAGACWGVTLLGARFPFVGQQRRAAPARLTQGPEWRGAEGKGFRTIHAPSGSPGPQHTDARRSVVTGLHPEPGPSSP